MATVTAALWRFGEVLPVPHIRSVHAIRAWYVEAGGAVLLVTVARLGALLVAIVLLVLAAARLAELLVTDTANGCIAWLAPGALRGLARGMAGLSLTAGLTSVPSVSGDPTGGGPGIALQDADERGSGTATMRRVDEPTPAATAATPPPAAVPPSPPPAAETVIVAHGDSFWSIAEEVVIDRGGLSDERSVRSYWQELVATNLANLIDPGNPDLIHPGQRLTLPPG
ncbi:MAG: LysM peptidoglycan-binding domain-containing protein [Acidimicrobiales bacterium]